MGSKWIQRRRAGKEETTWSRGENLPCLARIGGKGSSITKHFFRFSFFLNPGSSLVSPQCLEKE